MRASAYTTRLCVNNRGERNLVGAVKGETCEEISKLTEVNFYYGGTYVGFVIMDGSVTDTLFHSKGIGPSSKKNSPSRLL